MRPSPFYASIIAQSISPCKGENPHFSAEKQPCSNPFGEISAQSDFTNLRRNSGRKNWKVCVLQNAAFYGIILKVPFAV
jgi:hypothetical protein